MEAGATKKAYEEAIKLVSLNPSSDLGLRYAINSSGLLGKYDEFEKYTAQGINYFLKNLSIRQRGLLSLSVTRDTKLLWNS